MFTHSTWLVVFFWSHFWFQWFWFLSIIEVSEFFLRATLITINKWLQKLRSERKGLRLTVKPIKKKSLSRSSFGSHYGCLKSTKRKFSYELKSRVGRWGPHAPHWYFLHYFLKSSRLCDAQINLCFSITKCCTIVGGAYAWRRVFSEFLRCLTSRPFVLPGELVPNQKIDK